MRIMNVDTFEISLIVRRHLRLFLTKHFSLLELKDPCFDLSVDYEMFPHQTDGATVNLVSKSLLTTPVIASV